MSYRGRLDKDFVSLCDENAITRCKTGGKYCVRSGPSSAEIRLHGRGGIGGRCRSVRRVLRRIRVTNEVTRQRFTGAGVKPFRKGASDLGAWLGEKVNLASVNSHPPSELVCPGLETIGYAANIRDGNGIAGSGVELG